MLPPKPSNLQKFPPQWKHDQAFLPALHTVTAVISHGLPAVVYFHTYSVRWRTVDGDWGRGRGGEGRNTVGVSSLLFVQCNYQHARKHARRSNPPTAACFVLRPLLRGCSGGRLPLRPEYVGVCWGIGDRHVIIPAGQFDVLPNPDTHCRTVPCCSLTAPLACPAASHQSVRRLSSARVLLALAT